MRIGQLEDMTGLSRHALRYYEREALITGVRRSANGYRIYPDTAVRQVKLIKGLQSLGFDLRQVKRVIDAIAAGEANCADGAELLADKRREIRAQIRQLRQIDAQLRTEQQRLEDRAAVHAAQASGVFNHT